MRREVSALRASKRACNGCRAPRSDDRGYFLPALRAWSIVVAALVTGAALAQQPSSDPFAPQRQSQNNVKPSSDPFADPADPFAPDPPGAPFAEARLTSFHLTHAKAADVERILRSLFAGDFKSMAVDERTNSLIVNAGPGTTEQMKALLPRLDRQSADALLKSTPSDAAAASRNGYLGAILDDSDGQDRGVRIMSIKPGTPAEKSGLKIGDLITGIDGQPITGFGQLDAILNNAVPNQKLEMSIERGGKPQQVAVTLSERPAATASDQTPNPTFRSHPPLASADPAAAPRPLNPPAMSDEQMANHILRQFESEKVAGRLKDFSIDVEVNKGEVTLTGRVASEAQREHVITLVRQTLLNAKIVDRLAIKPSSGERAAALPGATSDANGITLPDGSRVQPDGSQIKVFTLKNIRAKEAERTITQLFARDVQSIAADERSNSLIVRGASHELNLIYQIVTRLDELDARLPQAGRSGQGESTTDGKFGGLIAKPAGSTSELAGKYEQLDGEAKRLARQLRELQAAPEAHAGPIKDLTALLHKVVTEAFAARQALHQAEVAQFQERVADIQQTLKTRDKLSKEIIDKRVKDLLNPELEWQAAGGGAAVGGNAAAGGAAGGGFGGAGADAAAGGGGEATAAGGAGGERPINDEYWANVKYGARHGSDADKIWNTLGVKVKPVSKQELPNKSYPFGAEITEIRPGSPADGLKVGDIIVTLGGSAFLSVPVLAQILAEPITNRSSINLKEFEKSEIAILRNGETRVFGIKFPLEPPALEPASTTPSIESPQSLSRATPNISLSGSGQAATIRTPADFRDQLRQWQYMRDLWKNEKKRSDETDEEWVARRDEQIQAFQQRLDLARAEYDAQIRLLELEVKDAQSAVEAADREVDRLSRSGVSSRSNEAKRALEAATVKLQRAKTLLELYRKADPQQATEVKPAAEPVAEEVKGK